MIQSDKIYIRGRTVVFMIIRNEQDLEGLRKIGRIVALAREEMKKQAKPGMTTKELDLIGKKVLDEHGAISAPEKEYDFPGVTCISVNEEVAHGIPGERVLKDGDLVNVDVSAALDGYYADTGISFVLGEDEAKEKLCQAAVDAFWAAMKKVKAGSKQNQIGRAVSNFAHKNGYNVIQNLTGHGIGLSLHEAPNHILSYFDPMDNALLKDGLVIAVEPFISMKADHIIERGDDGWTFVTPDKSLVAQCEHTVVVTRGEPIILTEI
ncbi:MULTISPECIES: type I methionyl aminopeptidase [Bacillus]|uniref:type I methionyl aminopeptidase n=1 Tax=Bacillus TaxID=1386 RepID=UPI00032E5600|nr:type I methionyl aminopeptidase [Bacillus wiedmannii]EOP15077.1 methionine aminopeptidase, type I [Bacillus cereus BAG2O-3]EOQ07450.1 methionine aminopeptidase, type I [Bacillus cereus B5-2]EOQ20482.1 methionine aminopeptidase, type I [Bacillus cereus BAG3O-1]MBJ8116682.1 type I methionyl aminopeptidase [Bacillus cereus]PFW83571.1 type I methionyl aminopeptidase [Bacillus sp. AFS075960]RFB11076.1 type I methionyl aminopeptidase [Bacillus sp. OE]RFB22207.1 type I methionyl aminopeptidase [